MKIEPISAVHTHDTFTCGDNSDEDNKCIDEYLKRALSLESPFQHETFVLTEDSDDKVVSYLSLGRHSIRTRRHPDSVGAKANDMLPVIEIFRLGTDIPYQGRGFGTHIVNYGLRRCIDWIDHGDDAVAITVVSVANHVSLYSRAGFTPLRSSPDKKQRQHMYLSIDKLRATRTGLGT